MENNKLPDDFHEKQLLSRIKRAQATIDSALRRLRDRKRAIDDRDELSQSEMAHLKSLEYAIGELVSVQDSLRGMR
jgi:hypothetical protein